MLMIGAGWYESSVVLRRAVGVFPAFLALLLLLWPAYALAEETFELRPQTRVKVTVLEWVSTLGEYREWTPLNGEYVISQAGSISVPLVGEVHASGRTARDVADEIAQALKRQTGLVDPPATTVEVVRFPSIYVNGSVDRPGEFEYRPGLTVLQALAMAGGRVRRTDTLGGYSELEQIRYIGELGRIELDMKRNAVKQARLRAELNGKTSIELPPEIGSASPSGAVAAVLEEEKAMFGARNEAFARQLRSLEELASLFAEEIKVLDEKMVAQDRQVQIAEAELKDVAKLVDSGTVTRSRETGLERILADLQSDRLDLAVASMRAKQRQSETERDVVNLKSQRKTEIVRDLQIVNAELEALQLRREITRQLLEATGASISRRGMQAMLEEQPLSFTIIRGGEGGETIQASPGTPLEPGDVLDVRLDLTEMASGGPSAAASASALGELLAR
ncbi:polysaccharide biosynthesis/export family protein [Chelativorans sp. AA-79]|uniref:polysaccharide biosynthesis/export family protein n=1 Tax=Chelativorans sp. AA-79 TaxID=3028735 RepID=UPI0023F71179|nr:polysaccharide biosynthesis/export family protein [Chelativorans sp. AA-79]WEX10474.1 polysaccharide biosynthesis/export family protein [Chelativorans sp. AA-79]